MKSDCCAAKVIERTYPSLFLSRTVYICGECGGTCGILGQSETVPLAGK